MIITIDRNIWNALLTAAAVNDVRHYLNTICIDFGNNKLIATSGDRMLLVYHQLIDNDTEYNQVLVNVSLKEHKAGQKVDKVVIDIGSGSAGSEVQITFIDSNNKKINALFTAVGGGAYPDYNKVLPTVNYHSENEQININPNYIVDVNRALRGTGFMPVRIQKVGKFLVKIDFGKVYEGIEYYISECID